MSRTENLPFIKGAVGHDDFARLAEIGANAVRISGFKPEKLDRAHAAGLGVLFNLPVRSERSGMDYDDAEAVAQQHKEVLETVRAYKNHPAVMLWCVGNELDHIPGAVDHRYNLKVWDAVNDICRDIHRIDPVHPCLTAVGMGRFGKVEDCVARCPELDLIGINAYGKIRQVAPLLRKHGWEKPWLFTEWGMTGMWERPKTEWGAPFEESSAAKAECYLRRYREAILAHPGRCLGGFAFYWGWRHETTLSWYNMKDPEGREMESVAVIEALYRDQPVDAARPQLFGVRVNGFAAPENVYLRPGQSCPLQALVAPGASPLPENFAWELRPEVEYGAYAGSGETLPPVVEGAIVSPDGPDATLLAPRKKGKYRVFAYLYDAGRFATANLPVFVGEPSDVRVDIEGED
ncbi:MAG: glycoside hydrolase family 2 TIM barrel-domain containing protein [Candidatus Sumerlaeota bacterium]